MVNTRSRDWDDGYSYGFDRGFDAGQRLARLNSLDLEDRSISSTIQERMESQPKKRKISAYTRRYKAAFKKLKSRYMTKAGKWKKDGFKRAVKAAHKEAKK